MINEVIYNGNIFESGTDAIVNPVNCVGIMGKGLALEFKNRYPMMFIEYKNLCDTGYIHPGVLHAWRDQFNGSPIIINFPTKNHYKDKSNMEYIISGLDYFIDRYKEWNIHSVAFPALGCGLGGLDFINVKRIMIDKLSSLPVNVLIYAPK